MNEGPALDQMIENLERAVRQHLKPSRKRYLVTQNLQLAAYWARRATEEEAGTGLPQHRSPLQAPGSTGENLREQ